MPRHPSTGKRLRFEVFKRDGFACQYCGAQPPAVVLVVDHIHAVSHGGASTIDNLVTACEACNQGKSDRPLSIRSVRPDADAMYLEAQQETAELRRYQSAAAERDAVRAEVIERLGDVWVTYAGTDWAPGDMILRSLIDDHGPEVAERAIVDVAGKVGTGYVKTHTTRWVGYLKAVARNLAAESGGGEWWEDQG